MKDAFRKDEYLSAGDVAFDTLSSMIWGGQFSPGQKLILSDLERMLRMSKTPIMVALDRLSKEGLVAHIKYRGYFVEDGKVLELKSRLKGDEATPAGSGNLIIPDHEVEFHQSPTNSVNQTTYERIRELILTSEFAPGQKLIYADLEAKLKVSKTPVTNALTRLESEGYVYLKRNAGYYVRNIKADEIYEMLEARLKIEVANIDFVINNITNKDLENLHNINKIHSLYTPDYYDKRKSQFNVDFHLELARIGKNRFMLRYMEHIYGWFSLRGRFSVVPSSRIITSGLEHKEILQALGSRDRRRTKMLLEKHLKGPIKDMLDNAKR